MRCQQRPQVLPDVGTDERPPQPEAPVIAGRQAVVVVHQIARAFANGPEGGDDVSGGSALECLPHVLVVSFAPQDVEIDLGESRLAGQDLVAGLGKSVEHEAHLVCRPECRIERLAEEGVIDVETHQARQRRVHGFRCQLSAANGIVDAFAQERVHQGGSITHQQGPGGMPRRAAIVKDGDDEATAFLALDGRQESFVFQVGFVEVARVVDLVFEATDAS